MTAKIIAAGFFVVSILELVFLSHVSWFIAFIVLAGVAINGFLVGGASERAHNQRMNAEALEKAKDAVGEARIEDDKLVVPIHKGVNGIPVINLGSRPAEHGS